MPKSFKDRINLLKWEGEIITLIKPIFEMEFHDLEKLDVILDPDILIELLGNLIEWCLSNRIYLKNIMKSPIPGKRGSVEIFGIF